MPFLESPQSSANFLWSGRQQETAEKKSLACHTGLDSRGQPRDASLQQEGRSHPCGVSGLGGVSVVGLGVAERSQAAIPHQSSYPWEATCSLISFFFLLRSPWYHQVMAVLQVAGRRHFCCRGLMPSGLCPGAEGAQASFGFQMLGNRRARALETSPDARQRVCSQ